MEGKSIGWSEALAACHGNEAAAYIAYGTFQGLSFADAVENENMYGDSPNERRSRKVAREALKGLGYDGDTSFEGDVEKGLNESVHGRKLDESEDEGVPPSKNTEEEISAWWEKHWKEAVEFAGNNGDSLGDLIYEDVKDDDEYDECIGAFMDQTAKHMALEALDVLGIKAFEALMYGTEDEEENLDESFTVDLSTRLDESSGSLAEAFICVGDGMVEIVEGAEAMAAEALEGNRFIVNPDYRGGEDEYRYYGKLDIGRNTFKVDAGLSGKRNLETNVDFGRVVYAIRKATIDCDKNDFWATWKETEPVLN